MDYKPKGRFFWFVDLLTCRLVDLLTRWFVDLLTCWAYFLTTLPLWM